MKNFFLIFFMIVFSCCKKGTSEKKIINVSDKDIALTVAEKKWKEVYGKSAINKQEPFVAEKKNDSIWIVRGTFPKPTIGDVAYAEVNINIKEVVKYTHGE